MYTNAQYCKDKLSGQQICIKVEINGIESFVPLDPANTNYSNIMALVTNGQLTISTAE
jgi:hypothetical protein